jgi:splicing factor U2AF subunit
MPAGKGAASDARILLMLNMVAPEDLVDDEEYGEIYEDVKEECSNFGAVEDFLDQSRRTKPSGVTAE